MIKWLRKRIDLYCRPPKTGDVFYGDCADFMCERLSERLFYPMSDRHGHEVWHFVPGDNTYVFTITSAAMPYYICSVKILVSSREDAHKKEWLERSHPRRIWKKDFHRLILQSRMVRTRTQSLFK